MCGLKLADGIGCQSRQRERQGARHIPTQCFGANADANPSFKFGDCRGWEER
jgi:hypothetical protein